MGTRGVFGVLIDGILKLGYNQFDSYPDGKGQENLEWLRSGLAEGKEEAWRKLARQLQTHTSEDKPTAAEITHCQRAHAVDLDVSAQSLDDWYCLTRETHGHIGQMLALGHAWDAHDFPADSLFCEWGYVVNFDDRVFEVYRGFQTKPHNKGRFADLPVEPASPGMNQYFPIALVARLSFDELPTQILATAKGVRVVYHSSTQVRWRYRGEPGAWESTDGRFRIEPLFEGSTRPQSYRLWISGTPRTRSDHDTVRQAKDEAHRVAASHAGAPV